MSEKWSPLEVYESESIRVGRTVIAWYWRIVARNGRIVCDSAEGYSSKAKALQGFKSAQKLASSVVFSVKGKKRKVRK